MSKIFNYLGEIFNEPTGKKSATKGQGLKNASTKANAQ